MLLLVVASATVARSGRALGDAGNADDALITDAVVNGDALCALVRCGSAVAVLDWRAGLVVVLRGTRDDTSGELTTRRSVCRARSDSRARSSS